MKFKKGKNAADPDGIRDEYRIDVTDKARAVFGDIAKYAEQVVDDAIRPGKLSAERAQRRADRIASDDFDGLVLNYGDVIVHFSNSAIVRFESSEWGYISKEAA